MHIGIDFDNTIINYDNVFYEVALEHKVVPPAIKPTKLAVRDWLRSQDKEEIWTEIQGYVYGARITEAEAYPGIFEFLRWAKSKNISVSIISQKTVKPFIGPGYDLHKSAKMWIEEHLNDETGPLIAMKNIYFEITRENKWARIASTAATHFIDDLPEILTAEAFPETAQRILFDPEGKHGKAEDSFLITMNNWKEILNFFNGKNSV